VRRGDDHRTCEIHEDRAHAGWDVQMFDNGWLSFAHRVETREEAQQLAASLREDSVCEGWMEKS
jgi:hypothetical protein